MRELKENIHIQTVAKLLIAVAAIAHLIFTYVHTSALLLLENQICGFIMFLFVLLGLVTLFESTQVHVSRSFAGYATIALCAATVGMGADLVSIYQTAIRTQIRWNQPWYTRQYGLAWHLWLCSLCPVFCF